MARVGTSCSLSFISIRIRLERIGDKVSLYGLVGIKFFLCTGRNGLVGTSIILSPGWDKCKFRISTIQGIDIRTKGLVPFWLLSTTKVSAASMECDLNVRKPAL